MQNFDRTTFSLDQQSADPSLTYMIQIVSPAPWPEKKYPHIQRLTNDKYHAQRKNKIQDSKVNLEVSAL